MDRKSIVWKLKACARFGGIYPSICLIASFVSSCSGIASSTKQGAVEDTGLRYWEWQDQDVLFRLTQRLPDQTRAFFLARGFEPEEADFIATRCVFQSMFKNTSVEDGEVIIDLQDWKVKSGTHTLPLWTRESWRQVPELADATEAAKIALEWSLLPTRQVYRANDYNWGMTSYGLAPGTVFDLQFSWVRAGKRFVQQLSEIECPTDMQP